MPSELEFGTHLLRFMRFARNERRAENGRVCLSPKSPPLGLPKLLFLRVVRGIRHIIDRSRELYPLIPGQPKLNCHPATRSVRLRHSRYSCTIPTMVDILLFGL